MASVLLLLAVAVVGWLYVLCRLVNRLSVVADRRVRLSAVGLGLLLLSPCALLWLAWQGRAYAHGWLVLDTGIATQHPLVLAGIAVGWASIVIELVRRPIAARVLARSLAARVVHAPVVVENVLPLIRWACPVRQAIFNLFARLPGNCIGKLYTFRHIVHIPHLPAGLDGLRIVQLSDLHHSPSLDDAYFNRIVDVANSLDPDIVVVTGDIAHSKTDAPTMARILARLRPKHGVFYVCGNHDIWHDPKELITALNHVGFHHVAGKVVPVAINGAVLHIAGTEHPWRKDTLPHKFEALPADAVCIALSHHPDNVRWLRRHAVDIVFSGHTHGGQISLAGLGPLLVPSGYGSRHAAGFVPYGRTLLHIHYGLSVTLPFRVLCPPEVACFTLKKP